MKFLVQNNQIVEGPLSNYPKTFELDGVLHPIREMANKGHDVSVYGWVEDATPLVAYDPATHRLGDITYTVENGKVIGDQAVVPLDKEERRVNIQVAHYAALNDMTYALADGSVVQTRPSDLTNFQLAIQDNEPADWVLADNTVRTLTVAEMQEAMVAGIQNGKALWSEYTAALRALK